MTLILIFNLTSHNGKLQTASLVTGSSTCDKYKDNLTSAINAIAKHSFLVKCQTNFLKVKRESLKANEVIVLGDFVEYNQFLVQDEIESYHWSKEYCTLYPVVLYFIDGDGNIQHSSLCFISDEVFCCFGNIKTLDQTLVELEQLCI